MTQQMRQILNILAENRCHMTADQICTMAPDVSRATVYRSLEHLVEEGKVQQLSAHQGKAIYEYRRAPHMHFSCRQCGNLYDVPADLTGMVREAMKSYGHVTDQVDIIAYGICGECQKNNESNKTNEQ